MPDQDRHPAGEVGRGVRAFVWTFLGAVVLCGFVPLNLWPLTDWRLFSHVRTDRLAGWEVATVDERGDEQPVPFGDLPARYRSYLHVASRLDRLAPDERLAVCRAWAGAVASARPGRTVVEVRVYATEASLRDPSFFRRERRATCDLSNGGGP